MEHVNNPWQSRFETNARARKVYYLTALLTKHEISAEDVILMTPEHWAMAAKAAGVNAPSVRTQAAVIDRMKGL